jgi:hypothetical protein
VFTNPSIVNCSSTPTIPTAPSSSSYQFNDNNTTPYDLTPALNLTNTNNSSNEFSHAQNFQFAPSQQHNHQYHHQHQHQYGINHQTSNSNSTSSSSSINNSSYGNFNNFFNPNFMATYNPFAAAAVAAAATAQTNLMPSQSPTHCNTNPVYNHLTNSAVTASPERSTNIAALRLKAREHTVSIGTI